MRRLYPILSVLTCTCVAIAPVSSTLASNEGTAQTEAVPDPKPRFDGVGLIVAGGLVGAVSVYPALFGGFTWMMSSSIPAEDEPFAKHFRTVFFVGLAGLVAGGGMLVGGIVLHQKQRAWQSRDARRNVLRARVVPNLGWNGQTHVFGLQGRF